MTRRLVSRALQRDVAIALTFASALESWETAIADHAGAPLEAVRGPRCEPRVVDQRTELFDMYTHLLLLRVRAQIGRLDALAAECSRRAAGLTLPRMLAARLGFTRSGRASGPVTLRPDRLRRRRQIHELAAALAVCAGKIVRHSGAAADPVVRTRLLAATRYQSSRDVLDHLLGDPSLAGPPDRLLAELRWLDTHAPRGDERA